MHDWINVDSLHVVSDLHLGGREGFQIFGSTAELAWLIDRVTDLPAPGRHALLINGDIIDFLAEEPSLCFDPDGAVAKLDSVWGSFKPVFVALQRLLKRPRRLLIVNLGNHDLELALPWVRAHLAQRLAPTEAARARLLWVTDGTAVRCRVGGANVVCVHGNEVDSWNVTDHERLRRIGRDRQFGLPAEAWTPNAGSRMVIDVMRRAKFSATCRIDPPPAPGRWRYVRRRLATSDSLSNARSEKSRQASSANTAAHCTPNGAPQKSNLVISSFIAERPLIAGLAIPPSVLARADETMG
jgi:hypothetical protein